MDKKRIEGLKARVEYGKFNFEHLRTRFFSYFAIVIAGCFYLIFSEIKKEFFIILAGLLYLSYINLRTLKQMGRVLKRIREDYKLLFKELKIEMPDHK